MAPTKEPHNNHKTSGRQTKQSNQLSLFPIKMIAKLEWTLSKTYQTQNLYKQWEVHKTINKQQQHHRLRTDSNLSPKIFALYSVVVKKIVAAS